MDLERIVAELKTERDRLDQAIAALEGKRTGATPKPAAPRAQKKSRRGHGLTAAGRKRLSEMMKKRWAERRKKNA